MTRPLTKKQTLAVIQSVIDLNARLLGEEPALTVRALPKNWIRVAYQPGKGPRNECRDYLGVEQALAVVWTSLGLGLRDWVGALGQVPNRTPNRCDLRCKRAPGQAADRFDAEPWTVNEDGTASQTLSYMRKLVAR